MNPRPATSHPFANLANAKTIFAQAGVTCSLIMLAPGDEVPAFGAEDNGRHVFYVVEGEVKVRTTRGDTVLYKDGAIMVTRADEPVLSTPTDGWAKLLRVEIPE